MTAVKTEIGANDEARSLLVQRIQGLTALQAQEALEEIVGLLTALSASAVSGPATSTDNAIARWDGATGDTLQNSLVTVDDTGIMNGAVAVGVNATADTTNRLSVNSAAVLFNHEGVGTQIKVNKNAAGNTGSFLFQTGFSGRAEFGTIGDNDFTLKTSPDGSAFTTALIADNSTGAIRISVNLRPTANDGAALGTTSARWSDLFGATGFVINFNSDWVATHTAGIVTVGTGDLRVTTAGTNAASVVTVGGTQTLTSKTLTSPTITTSPTAAGATWANLGSVTTIDINGGTVDGTVIGGASAAAITGTVITGNRFVPNSATVPTDGMYLPATNTLGWAINSAAEMQLTSTALSPAVNDGNALGTATLSWGDLFLASGAVINFNNSDVTLTHSSNFLTMAGGNIEVLDLLADNITVGTATTSNIAQVYALSDEGNYTAIQHTLSDDYNRILRISRVASSDGNHVPMDIALASRGTLDVPLAMQAGDRSWAVAGGGQAADGTWQRLFYQWVEAKENSSGNSIPGMWVIRLTKPGQFFPDTNTFTMDWLDGARFGMHYGFRAIVEQTDAATISWNVREAQVAEVTLGGNRTLQPSNMQDGFEYDFYVTADASARSLSLGTSGGMSWFLRGSDGRFYDQNSAIQLPANGFAHLKLNAGGSGLVVSGTVTFIVGHPRRAVVPSKQITSLTSGRSGSNVNTAQAVFGSTEDTLTVAASTSYRFEAVYSFNTAATTNHNISVLFGGTATYTGIGYHVLVSSNETSIGGTTLDYVLAKHSNVATAFEVLNTVNENPLRTTIKLSGIMRINASGTVIPQIQFSAAPGAAPSFLAGSYFELWPIGDNNVVAVGDWS